MINPTSINDDGDRLIVQESRSSERTSSDLSDLFDQGSLHKKRLNAKTPGFTARMKLYLKPRDGRTCLHLLLLLIDAVLANLYVISQIFFVASGKYTFSEDKII